MDEKKKRKHTINDFYHGNKLHKEKYGFIEIDNPEYYKKGNGYFAMPEFLLRKPTPDERKEIIVNYIIAHNSEYIDMFALADELCISVRLMQMILKRLREEKVCGTMPEERFDLLAKNYEAEQAELKQKVETRKANLSVNEESEKNIAKFVAIVKSYTEVTELTPEILNSFIDKIYIGAPHRVDKKQLQEVKIVYKLVGAVNIPQ